MAGLVAFIIMLIMAPAQIMTDGRRSVRLESQTATLVIDVEVDRSWTSTSAAD